MASQAQQNAASQFQPQQQQQQESDSDDDGPPPLTEIEDEAAVDETGVEGKDIDLVMQQANVTRAQAVKALRDSDNDIGRGWWLMC
jgi:nascent polypeptide-associated complex subunit alpha